MTIPPSDILEYLFSPILFVSRIAPIATIGVFSALIPISAAWRRRRSLPSPLRWAAIYLAATLAEEMFMLYWSRTGRSNLWIINVYNPFAAIFLGLMFAGLQLRERWRTVINVVTGIFPVFWGAMMLTVENIRMFPLYTQPVQSLLVITAAAWTLVQRTRYTVSPVTRHSWFWVSVGALFYFVYLLLLDPFSRLLVHSNPQLVTVAHEINGALITLMNAFWLRAILLVRIPSKAEGNT